MKYFIYTRKSTDSEERQVMSLESQLSELKEFAAKALGVPMEDLVK
jgi:DNA invertase Pin-like site-specific DNA recombinase